MGQVGLCYSNKNAQSLSGRTWTFYFSLTQAPIVGLLVQDRSLFSNLTGQIDIQTSYNVYNDVLYTQ